MPNIAAPLLPTHPARCRFAAAAGLMPLRTRLGGETRLQQALCLDSLGRNQEAYDIYVKIESHSAPGVAKKAKRWVPAPDVPVETAAGAGCLHGWAAAASGVVGHGAGSWPGCVCHRWPACQPAAARLCVGARLAHACLRAGCFLGGRLQRA